VLVGVAQSRRRRAIGAAREAARLVGLSDASARVLRDANNTLVLLPEAGVVAKVATSELRERGADALTRELAIGLHLAARAAPIVLPLPVGVSGPHDIDGLVLTLWSYCEPNAMPGPAEVDLGTALRAVHEGLADFPDPLPPLWEKIERAATLFARRRETPGLAPADRRAAATIYERLRPALDRVAQRSPLHGEPHASTCFGRAAARFSSTSRGPVRGPWNGISPTCPNRLGRHSRSTTSSWSPSYAWRSASALPPGVGRSTAERRQWTRRHGSTSNCSGRRRHAPRRRGAR
jgi:hypothetical protein